MRHTKILGLALIAAAALMAMAGSASATTVTTTTGGAAATPTIHAVNEGGHLVLANSNANIECEGGIEGTVETHGSGVTAEGSGSIAIGSCTNGWTVTVEAKGVAIAHWTSGHNGTITSSGSTVTAVLHTIFGDVTCRYVTNNTFIGTATGGNPGTLHVEASIPFHSGGGLCGSGSSTLSGKAVSTSALYVAP
jgi:hypothetical protein